VGPGILGVVPRLQGGQSLAPKGLSDSSASMTVGGTFERIYRPCALARFWHCHPQYLELRRLARYSAEHTSDRLTMITTSHPPF